MTVEDAHKIIQANEVFGLREAVQDGRLDSLQDAEAAATVRAYEEAVFNLNALVEEAEEVAYHEDPPEEDEDYPEQLEHQDINDLERLATWPGGMSGRIIA